MLLGDQNYLDSSTSWSRTISALLGLRALRDALPRSGSCLQPDRAFDRLPEGHYLWDGLAPLPMGRWPTPPAPHEGTMSPPQTRPKGKQHAASHFRSLTSRSKSVGRSHSHATLKMATCRFDIFDSTNQLYELGNVHHTLGVPHYTADPLSSFEGTFRLRRQGGKGRFSHRTNVRTDSRPA